MGTDDLFKERKGNRKKRKERNRQIAVYRYLIVCEGKETEPNYFEGIKRKIDAKYRDKIDIKHQIDLNIEGLGRNTEDLVNCAIKMRSFSDIPYGHVWVVFDKDDFDQFNNAIYLANDNGIKTAWSNNSFELWILLHFEYLNSAIHRYQYIAKLDDYFKQYNINNGKYDKNIEHLFDVLYEGRRVEQAIQRSKKLREYYCGKRILVESEMNPCTTVDLLVEELLSNI